MPQTISFNPKWLKAAALIAARHDIRYYLNGVLVEVFANEARLVATDGHRMVIFRKLVDGAAPGRFIVPTSILDMLKPQAKSHKVDAALHYEPDNSAAKVTLEYFGIGIQFNPIDGKYPDYTQTMNKATAPSGQICSFNPIYLADFKRAAEMAFGPNNLYHPSIWHNGEAPAAVTYMGRDDFFGILMPMRNVESFKVPVWALPLPEEKKEPEEALAA